MMLGEKRRSNRRKGVGTRWEENEGKEKPKGARRDLRESGTLILGSKYAVATTGDRLEVLGQLEGR